MAQLIQLFRLRVLLSLRRFSGHPGLFAGFLLGLGLLVGLGLFLSVNLLRLHAELPAELSPVLLDLTTLGVTVFLVVGPLMGFRTHDAMDVSLLFEYPIPPLRVFLSMVFGQFLGTSTLFLAPILILPPLGGPGGMAALPRILLTGLLYLLVLFSLVQCLVLLTLNILKSRRFRDLKALISPLFAISFYLLLRFLVFKDLGDPRAFQESLGRLDPGPFVPWLPPLWFSRAPVSGTGVFFLRLLLLLGIFVLLCRIGVDLTLRAFHGEIAIAPREKGARGRRGLCRRLLSSLLPAPLSAVYEKELDTLKREPFLRSLLIQQLGFVVLFLVFGLTLGGEEAGGFSRGIGLGGASLALLFVESGFLLNILSLEGPGILHTASLPLRPFHILAGKNLAHLHILGTLNLGLIPLLGLLQSRIEGVPYPASRVVLLLSVCLILLPVLSGMGNLLSVHLPSPIPRRGKRALGQDRTGQEGCLSSLYRVFFTFLTLMPASLVGLVVFLPVLLGQPLGSPVQALALCLGLGLSAGLYAMATALSAHHLGRSFPRILQRML